MKFIFAIGGIGLGIWGQIFLSSLQFTPVSGIELILPLKPSWRRYLAREGLSFDSLGRQIDYAKTFIPDDCPVGETWDSLAAMQETVVLATNRLKAMVQSVRRADPPERARILEQYNNPNSTEIMEVGQMLDELAVFLDEQVKKYKTFYTYIKQLPGRRTPDAGDLPGNRIRLSLALNWGKGRLENGKSMVVFRSDGRQRFIEGFDQIRGVSRSNMRKMTDLVPFVTARMRGPGFDGLFEGRDPENYPGDEEDEEDEDDEGDEQGDEGNGQGDGQGDGQEGNIVNNGMELEEGGGGGGGGGQGQAPAPIQEPYKHVYPPTKHLENLQEWFECWEYHGKSIMDEAMDFHDVPYPPSWNRNLFPAQG
ncbi:hypothetical protein TWF718_002629 [Orbilia javanica]|uniref:Uncharacterized protein n=1 Tax=Orbilia javanica TaxID=47235 RepID=A0AAN8MKE1_9PEZI